MIRLYTAFYNYPEAFQWLRNCNYYYWHDCIAIDGEAFYRWNDVLDYVKDTIKADTYSGSLAEMLEAWDEEDNSE